MYTEAQAILLPQEAIPPRIAEALTREAADHTAAVPRTAADLLLTAEDRHPAALRVVPDHRHRADLQEEDRP